MTVWAALGNFADRLFSPLDARLFGGRRAREEGAATVEFAVLFPVLVVVFVSSVEASVIMMRQIMFERAVDLATRPLRLDGNANLGLETIANDICAEGGPLMIDCRERMRIEMTKISMDSYALPDSAQPCITRETESNPPDVFETDRVASLMVLRACYAAQPFMPLAGIGAVMVAERDGGSVRMVVTTAFRVEPSWSR